MLTAYLSGGVVERDSTIPYYTILAEVGGIVGSKKPAYNLLLNTQYLFFILTVCILASNAI